MSKDKYVVAGIDPGKTGAIAYIRMPDLELFSVVGFRGNIEKCRLIEYKPRAVYLESVTASPQMGVVSAFTFGRWAEAPETCAHIQKLCLYKVRPSVWQQALGCVSRGSKDALFNVAKRLYPRAYANRLFNKSTADAVLIAYYGCRREAIRKGLKDENK